MEDSKSVKERSERERGGFFGGFLTCIHGWGGIGN